MVSLFSHIFSPPTLTLLLLSHTTGLWALRTTVLTTRTYLTLLRHDTLLTLRLRPTLDGFFTTTTDDGLTLHYSTTTDTTPLTHTTGHHTTGYTLFSYTTLQLLPTLLPKKLALNLLA